MLNKKVKEGYKSDWRRFFFWSVVFKILLDKVQIFRKFFELQCDITFWILMRFQNINNVVLLNKVCVTFAP